MNVSKIDDETINCEIIETIMSCFKFHFNSKYNVFKTYNYVLTKNIYTKLENNISKFYFSHECFPDLVDCLKVFDDVAAKEIIKKKKYSKYFPIVNQNNYARIHMCNEVTIVCENEDGNVVEIVKHNDEKISKILKKFSCVNFIISIIPKCFSRQKTHNSTKEEYETFVIYANIVQINCVNKKKNVFNEQKILDAINNSEEKVEFVDNNSFI
jgi:hypothetical protein